MEPVTPEVAPLTSHSGTFGELVRLGRIPRLLAGSKDELLVVPATKYKALLN